MDCWVKIRHTYCSGVTNESKVWISSAKWYENKTLQSERVIVVVHKYSNFSAISWRVQVNFQWEVDEIRYVLNQHTELDFNSASSLKQQSANRHVGPLGPYPEIEGTFLINIHHI
jgi:hypothetical protein